MVELVEMIEIIEMIELVELVMFVELGELVEILGFYRAHIKIIDKLYSWYDRRLGRDGRDG